MQIRIRQRIETKESIIRMDKRMILRMLRRSIYTLPPTTEMLPFWSRTTRKHPIEPLIQPTTQFL